MTTTPQPVVLASSSVYRRRLLGRLLTDFECLSPGIDESRLAGESPAALASRLAATKAQSCAEQCPGAVIIGSDQVAALGEDILGKPGSHQPAVQQLRRCSGQTVVFYTAVALIGSAPSAPDIHIDETTVRFRELTDTEIEKYLNADQPYDCAGSFKVESRGVILFNGIDSQDPTGLQGLPLIWVAGRLRALGIDLL